MARSEHVPAGQPQKIRAPRVLLTCVWNVGWNVFWNVASMSTPMTANSPSEGGRHRCRWSIPLGTLYLGMSVTTLPARVKPPASSTALSRTK